MRVSYCDAYKRIKGRKMDYGTDICLDRTL
jgi:hypothetical protein